MTYREFGEKYLTPPERERYFHNILTLKFIIDVKSLDEHKPSGKCFFCDTFHFIETPENTIYWCDVEKRVLRSFDTVSCKTY